MKVRRRTAILVFLVGVGLPITGAFWASTAPEHILMRGQRNVPGEIRRHPNAEYLVRPAHVPFHEITTETSELPESLQRHLDRLLAASEVASIGVFEGPDDAFILGEVGDVVVSGDQVYVLDVQAENVRVFSTAGAHLTTFGGSGQGPGEFVRPGALTIGPGSENIWVVDQSGRLSQFSLADMAPRFVGTIQVEGGVQDVCFAADETLVVHNLLVEESGPLQRLTTAGEVTASFGHKAYLSPSVSIGYSFINNVRIDCSDHGSWVFYGSALGELRGYRGNGELAWIAAITNFTWPDMRELEDGRYTVLAQAHSSELVGLTLLPDETDEALLVQVSQLESRDEGWRAETRLDSYLLDPFTGKGSYVGSDLPLVVAARPGMSATLTDDEYPRIALLGTGGF